MAHYVYGEKEKIVVDYYPGTATVIVDDDNEVTQTTPGILKLPKRRGIDRGDSYQRTLFFLKGGIKSKPISINCEYKSARYATLISLFSPTALLFPSAKASIWECTPKELYVIDKEEAVNLRDIHPLIRILKKSKIVGARVDAAEALGNIGDVGASTPLIAALDDPSYEVKVSAVYALGQIKSDEAVKPLINILKNEDEDVFLRSMAARSLSQIGAPSVERLIALLNEKDDFLKIMAVEALGSIGDARCFVPLIAVLAESNNIDVLTAVSMTLWKIDGKRTLNGLKRLLKEENDIAKNHAAFCIATIGSDTKEAAPLLTGLSPILTEVPLVKIARQSVSHITGSDSSAYRDSVIREYGEKVLSQSYQQSIMQEKIQSGARGGPNYSSTEMSTAAGALGGYIAASIIDSIDSWKKRRAERKERDSSFESSEIDKLLKSEYSKYIVSDSISPKTDSSDTKLETTIDFKMNVYHYALDKIAGEVRLENATYKSKD